MRLMNQSRNCAVISDLKLAKSEYERMKGLLGRADLPTEEGLWIKRTNSVHTWFMKFPIDVIFVDKNLRVTSVHHRLPAWRITFPRWRSNSVFEMAAGRAEAANVQVGDQLHVVD